MLEMEEQTFCIAHNSPFSTAEEDQARRKEKRKVLLLLSGLFVCVVGAFAFSSGSGYAPSPAGPAPGTSLPAELSFLSAEPGADFMCTNVLDWNFFGSKVTQNNLGGQGPNMADKHEIRYSSVITKGNEVADLVVTIDASAQVTPYWAANNAQNGLSTDVPGVQSTEYGYGQFGQVNIMSGTAAHLKVQLMKSGTDTPFPVSEDEKLLFSVYDLDFSANKKDKEYVDFTSPVASYAVTPTSTVVLSGDKNQLHGEASRVGDAADNPLDPLHMTQTQEDSKISVTYMGVNEWTFTFGDKRIDDKHPGGRNLMFAGRSVGDCPCVGVSDWKLHNNLKNNNLGGKGPVFSDPQELRYSKVFEAGWQKTPVDLVISVAPGSTYDPANTALNGLWPTLPDGKPDHTQMSQINIRCSTESTFDFRFVESGTDNTYPLSNTFFSVYDLDQKKLNKDGSGVNHEYVVFPQSPSDWKISPTNSEVIKSGDMADGTLRFTSSEAGNLEDNPTDPRGLTNLQQRRSVTVWYADSTSFQVTLGCTCDNPEGGRNMLFAGPGIFCPTSAN